MQRVFQFFLILTAFYIFKDSALALVVAPLLLIPLLKATVFIVTLLAGPVIFVFQKFIKGNKIIIFFLSLLVLSLLGFGVYKLLIVVLW